LGCLQGGNRKKELAIMQELLDQKNMKLLKKKAHGGKGTSWMYGFKTMGDLFQELEKIDKIRYTSQKNLKE